MQMQGNVYIALNTDTYKSKIPTELQERYNYTRTDDEGNNIVITPTFEELAELNRAKYGSPIKLKVGSRNIYIVELTASWLNSEVSSLIELGANLSYPQNTLLTAEEAQELIAANSEGA